MTYILVIGEKGAGKTSLINLLVNEKSAAEQIPKHGLSFTQRHSWQFCFTEVVGIDDVDTGNQDKMLKNFMKLANEIKNNGISLILYVMNKESSNPKSRKNYDFFVYTLCSNQVPCFLVVTHCKSSNSEDQWVYSEEQNLGMKFAGYMTGSMFDLSSLAVTHEQSWKKIEELTLKDPWRPSNPRKWIMDLLHGVVASDLPMDTVDVFIECLLGKLIGDGTATWIKNAFKTLRMDSDEDTKKNILVIGETGTGKSSVLNLILGKEEAEVSDSATRGTFTTTRYEYGRYHLLDTVGFNDVDEKNSTDGLKKLTVLAKQVNKEGISLVIYVMKKGRVTGVSRKNYEYFVNTLCNKQVPVLLVVTHCESQSRDFNWYTEEKDKFNRLGMTFIAAVNGCAMKLDSKIDPEILEIYKRKLLATQKDVRMQIGNLALKKPWKPQEWYEYYARVCLNGIALGFVSTAFHALSPVISMMVTPDEASSTF